MASAIRPPSPCTPAAGPSLTAPFWRDWWCRADSPRWVGDRAFAVLDASEGEPVPPSTVRIEWAVLLANVGDAYCAGVVRGGLLLGLGDALMTVVEAFVPRRAR